MKCKNQQEILNLEQRLKELDKARNDLISLISEGGSDEDTLEQLGIRHKLIRPYTLRHNGKVERSYREAHNKFYSCHNFYPCDDLNVQLAARLTRTNNRPMRPLNWLSPIEFFNSHCPI